MKAQEVYNRLKEEDGFVPDSFEAIVIANDYAKKNPDSNNVKRFNKYMNSTKEVEQSKCYGAALLVIAEKLKWI